MQAAVGERSFGGRRLAFRIGINSGPVVAGVIGRKKFIYDLWGDSVNLASRMESQGRAGAVQITEPTRRLVRERFVCEDLGTVDVKGAEATWVWQVVGDRRAAEPSSRDATHEGCHAGESRCRCRQLVLPGPLGPSLSRNC